MWTHTLGFLKIGDLDPVWTVSMGNQKDTTLQKSPILPGTEGQPTEASLFWGDPPKS